MYNIPNLKIVNHTCNEFSVLTLTYFSLLIINTIKVGYQATNYRKYTYIKSYFTAFLL